MKKFVSLLAMLILCMCVFTACSQHNPEEPDNGSSNESTDGSSDTIPDDTIPPTSDEEGKEEEDSVHVHKAAEPVNENEVPATCLAYGSYEKVIYCSICNEELSRISMESPIVDHSFSDGSCIVCKAKEASEGLQFTFNSDATTYSVTGIGSCIERYINIPAEYDGYPVTAISSNAFKDCITIRSIGIPDSVTSIGQRAFSGCISLRSVNIGNGVKTIEQYAFSGCTSLSDITFGSSLNYIRLYAFQECTSLKNVHIEDIASWCGITFEYYGNSSHSSNYDSRPFYYATNLCFDGEIVTDLVIPEGVTSINSEAFRWCESIESVTISESVETIGSRAFYACTNLLRVKIDDGVSTVGSSAFATCTNLKDVAIGTNVVTIGTSAFSGCSSVESITIPTSVVTIGNSAFQSCTSLKTAVLNDGLVNINASAFSACISLASISVPNTVTYIGESAFSGCSSLNTVKLSNSLASISSYTFQNCISLYEITIPDSVTSIGTSAFQNSTVRTVDIGNGVKTIEQYAFSGCTSLSDITFGSSLNYIRLYAFQECTSLKNVHIEDIASWCGITFEYYGNSSHSSNYDSRPFYYATNLCFDGEIVTDLVIPEGVTSINSEAFRWCESIESITIPESIIYIGANAFTGTSITNATFMTPAGWWYASSSGATNGTAILEENLADPTIAVREILNYTSYYWHRKTV